MLKRLELPSAYAELLAQSQGPAFLQPGQLGDQIPMAVSRDRSQADAGRQQSSPGQMNAGGASRDVLQSDEASVAVGGPGAGVHRAGAGLPPAVSMVSPVTVKPGSSVCTGQEAVCLSSTAVCLRCWPHWVVLCQMPSLERSSVQTGRKESSRGCP